LLIASRSAYEVLLFGVPASPLAQPWPIMGGSLIAALIGVASAHLLTSPLIAAAMAVSLSYAQLGTFAA
jgi:CBS domain-containing membrane protein